MFIILLKFSKNREQAGLFMDSQMKWLKQGFDENTFFLAGTIMPATGGAILAKGASFEAIQKRVQQDPFVIENIVEAEILEIKPAKLDERFTQILNQ